MTRASTGGRSLDGQKIVLGVTGGIAAYKAAELARRLIKRGAVVRVVMTANAERFVTPLTFATLTQAPVTTSLWTGGEGDNWSIEHISNARWGDLLLVAPATANIVGKFANGVADDALTTLYLAWRGPVLIAPAMNTAMFEHPAYQTNEATLRGRGVEFVDPGVGDLACGEEGQGRLAEVEDIIAAVEVRLGQARLLEGVRVLITAGPTREFLDPMRFLSNPSSGKMGYALADQARRMGAEVTLVSGPVNLPAPTGVERIEVVSAEQMDEAVAARSDCSDLLIFSAAVADFAPSRTAKDKIKKDKQSSSLRLRRTPDIARAFGERKRPGQVSIGFAAETRRVVESARRKLREKRFDLVVANPVSASDNVFGSNHNKGWLVGPTGRAQRLERTTKSEMASSVLLRATELLREKKGE